MVQGLPRAACVEIVTDGLLSGFLGKVFIYPANWNTTMYW